MTQVPKNKRSLENRIYYLHHKDEIYSKPVLCECGAVVSKSHLSRHRGTMKHQVCLEILTNPSIPENQYPLE